MWLRLLLFIAILGLVEYYSFIVIRSAVRNLPSIWRIGVISVYVLITVLAWSAIIFFRQINWAHLPHLLRNLSIAVILGMTVGKVLMTLVMLVDEIRRIALWIFQSFQSPTTVPMPDPKGISRSTFLTRFALLLGGFALGGFVYGVKNRYNYHVRRVRLSFKSLPEAFKGMKVVQISDIHTGSFDSHHAVERGVQKIIDEKPDLVLFTGDLVNNKSEEAESYKEIFARIKAPLGVYSSLGNHDYGDYVEWDSPAAKKANLDRLKQIHAEMGWRLLLNEHVELEKNGEKIAIVGIENWGAKGHFSRYGDMKKAYEGLPEKNIPFKMLLSHDPSHWDAQVTPEYKDIQLTLAGHTHGMQFGVEIPGLKWSPIQYMYQKWAGLYQEGEQYLYVNRGFGFLGYPGRLGILPEITVFEFV
ncbi:metallophosphoesterase [Taibaiella soli]|uniref:Metallophosphoesterase n=1 Tax=Taibaiella soli TaxID=1649169 RepID=A0A2W2BXG5_9BACT|nr:metallophosphoesterase [Taibaiella soli]PZF72553.1 metallophosphoesterase [Taibaiella soli]